MTATHTLPETYVRRAAEGMLRSMAHYGDRYPTVGDGRCGTPQWYVNMLGRVLHVRGDDLPVVEGVIWHGLRWKRYAEILLAELDGEPANIWGTDESLIGEGFCLKCEREGGRHYSTCPMRP